jgi:orotidine-5'-phosphate decarboxylase
MPPMDPRDRIIVALDTQDQAELLAWSKKLGPEVGAFKIGLEALYGIGPKACLETIGVYGRQRRNVFVDCKLHDIPETMKRAAQTFIGHPSIRFLNVHASAGPTGMRAVASVKGDALLLAVTVLTSLDDEECVRIFGADTQDTVERLAELTQGCGVDGIICAPTDVAALRKRFPGMLLVTPGVRPEWAAANDQKRVMTPKEAMRAGSDYLVIGRPITKPPESMVGSPAVAAQSIARDIGDVKL